MVVGAGDCAQDISEIRLDLRVPLSGLCDVLTPGVLEQDDTNAIGRLCLGKDVSSSHDFKLRRAWDGTRRDSLLGAASNRWPWRDMGAHAPFPQHTSIFAIDN